MCRRYSENIMIHINKNSEPDAFRRYHNSNFARFDDMPGEVKSELRKSLLNEQGYICAYCMSRIKEDDAVKIEHYQARNASNELIYTNLFAVCNGNEGQRREYQICDTRKGQEILRINPLHESDIRTISYKTDGTIWSSNTDFDTDLNHILNLNCENTYLKANRKAAIDAIVKRLTRLKPGESAENLLRRLKVMYEAKDAQGEYKPYVGAILWCINKRLKKYQN